MFLSRWGETPVRLDEWGEGYGCSNWEEVAISHFTNTKELKFKNHFSWQQVQQVLTSNRHRLHSAWNIGGPRVYEMQTAKEVWRERAAELWVTRLKYFPRN